MEVTSLELLLLSTGRGRKKEEKARASFKFAKQVGIRSGTIDPYHHHDPPLPPPSNDAKQSLIDDYEVDQQLDEFRLKLFTTIIEVFHHPRQHGPFLLILLPEYEP
eukprot:5395491-Ditylum_brightwellii.AAC.1